MSRYIDVDKYRKDLLSAYDEVSMEFEVLDRQPLVQVISQESFKNAYIQVAKERDIAIEQLNELGYSLGEKIEPCNKVRAEIEAQEKWLAEAGYNAYNVGVAFFAIKRALEK